jgi:SET domain-containing protein
MRKERVAVGSAGDKGLGVFATSRIETGEVIEVCHVVVEAEKNIADGANLDRYVYEWTPGNCAVALGYGSIFNHSYDPNAVFVTDKAKGTITFTARRPIDEGQEITINYNGDPASKEPVDFACAE